MGIRKELLEDGTKIERGGWNYGRLGEGGRGENGGLLECMWEGEYKSHYKSWKDG